MPDPMTFDEFAREIDVDRRCGFCDGRGWNVGECHPMEECSECGVSRARRAFVALNQAGLDVRAVVEGREQDLPDFETVWARMEARGYQYGEDALAGVRFGWKLARANMRPDLSPLRELVERWNARGAARTHDDALRNVVHKTLAAQLTEALYAIEKGSQ